MYWLGLFKASKHTPGIKKYKRVTRVEVKESFVNMKTGALTLKWNKEKVLLISYLNLKFHNLKNILFNFVYSSVQQFFKE